jgi:MT0933-like antitoxin protein
MGTEDSFANKAEEFARQHPQDVDKGLQEAGKIADEKTGDRYSKQIDEGIQDIEHGLGGGGQGQGSGQDQSGQGQAGA